MKTKKGLKRIAALLMCVVLLATSLPIALAANGAYNPAPYFTQKAQEKGAAAWLDAEGNLQIRFPAATGRPTHAVWSKNPDEAKDVKAIDYYIVELSDLGGKLEKHNTTPPVLRSKKVMASEIVSMEEGDTLQTMFTAAEIGDLLNVDDNRYNVAITAVDEAGWFSLTLNALIFDVPEFTFDINKFEVLSEDAFAMREMMRFEVAGDYSGYVQTGNTINKVGTASQTGTDDPATGINSTGYRILITGRPGEGGQIFDTPESRQTWDFTGADEVWYWMDLSDVELQGVSFRLGANDKKIDWNLQSGDFNGGTKQHYSSQIEAAAGPGNATVYSTLGAQYNAAFNAKLAAGEAYVQVQNANGNWERVAMNADGTVNLGHIKGYVRVPIEYFCSETDTTVTAKNTVFQAGGQGYKSDSQYNSYLAENITLNPAVTVDPKGTPVAEALLIQQSWITCRKSSWNIAAGSNSTEIGHIIAPGIENADIKKADNPRRATLTQTDGTWVVENRENAYKSLEDIYSAGFSYTGVSEDSVDKSIFLDDIMFYRTDGERWNKADLSGFEEKTEGAPVSIYYNQRTDAQDRVLDAIDEYIGSPSWTDYRGVQYVTDMIEAYYAAFTAKKNETTAKQVMSEGSLAERAANVGRSATWQNYVDAKKLCGESGLLESNNSMPNDLVPLIVQSLEALPDPSQVTGISDALREEVVKIYQAYVRLNYGQLKMLGSYAAKDADGNVTALYEEEKLLAYVELLADQLNSGSFVTGYKVANYPFVPFNTFENNTEIGDKAWRLEDDPNYSGESDYRHYKNFTSFTTGDKKVLDGKDYTINQSYNDLDSYTHAADTAISNSGYNGSKGLTTTFDSTAIQGNDNGGAFYTVLMNRDSVNTAQNFSEFKTNNMAGYNLGSLALNNNDALIGEDYLPFSLMMYVDFSELTDESGAGDFTFGVKIHTVDGSGNVIAYRPAMGSLIGGNEKWRSFFMLDQELGEWKRVYIKDRGAVSGIYMFPSKNTNTAAEETGANLAGYKGYIAIPMNHFKRGGMDNDFLVEKADCLNNIYSIQIGLTNANGKAMDNKSFTIDNVGFTYDPSFYSSKGINTATRGDQSYAEVFGAKSTKAVDFENAVAAIDPYDTETLAEKIEAAKDIYGYPYRSETQMNTLSQWQKDNLKTVKQAKALLDKYIAGDIPPAAMTVAELKEKLADASFPKVPEKAISTNPLPNPGFLIDSSAPLTPGEVNYAAFGFESKAQAEEIAAYYTDTYRRLSAADKESLTAEEKEKLLNAYNAAMRCAGTLEMVRDTAISFADELKTGYTRYTDGTQTLNLIRASEREKIATLSANQYEELAYYAKSGLGNGTVIPAYAGMTDGLSRYLENTKKVTVEGEEIEAGVYKLMAQYTKLYKDVKAKLDAKETLPDDLVAQLQEAVAEYNDLLPAYKNVFELYYGSEQDNADGDYQGIKDILDLFLQTDVAFADGTTETTLTLNEENIGSASQTLNVNYLEEYPMVTGGETSTYFTLKYDGYLASGVTLRTYQLMLNGNAIAPVAYDAEGIRLEEKDLGDALKNNTYTAENPFKMVFTAKLTDKQPFAQQLSDKVTVKHYRPADPEKGETEPKLLGTYILNINYTPDEGYMVSIPAEFPVDWGTATTDVSYSVDCVLKEGSKIAVNVAGAGQLTAVKDASLKMNYTAQDFAPTEFRGVQTAVKPMALPMVLIDENTWNTVPVGEYRDTLTYTVEYTSAP